MCSSQEPDCLSYFLWPEGQEEGQEVTKEQRDALHKALRGAGWNWENQ
jgi:hypothetical protein